MIQVINQIVKSYQANLDILFFQFRRDKKFLNKNQLKLKNLKCLTNLTQKVTKSQPNTQQVVIKITSQF